MSTINFPRRFSWGTAGVSAAVVLVVASLGVVVNSMPQASHFDFTGAGWSEDQEVRFQQLESCSERLLCQMTYAEQKEFERLAQMRPEHVQAMSARSFSDIPNYFSLK